VDTADLRPRQRVLIHAAAGGVGHLAVQIAKHRGAHVVGTARADKHDFLRSIGADEVVDYTRVDFAEHVRDIDVALDGVGGDYPLRSLRTMRPAECSSRSSPKWTTSCAKRLPRSACGPASP
jgi:NADPH:quinone reductase-like Zn-dependent oxidoreductase